MPVQYMELKHSSLKILPHSLAEDDWFRDFLEDQPGDEGNETARLLKEAHKTREQLCKK